MRNSSSKNSTASPAALALATLACVMLFSSPVRAADDADAAKLWTKHCQTCHGPDGKGKTKAGEKAKVKDLTAADVKADLTRAKAIDSMKNGIKEKGSDKFAMKSYSDKLSAAEMEKLADHVLSFK